MRGRKPAKWSEKELELYTYQNLSKLSDALCPEIYELFPDYAPSMRLLGSQIKTSAGIIDALILSHTTLYVVEFKAIKASERALGQLQRYRSVISAMWAHPRLNQALPPRLCDEVVMAFHESLQLMIIAPHFSKEALLGADICIETHKKYGEFHYENITPHLQHCGKNFELEHLISPYVDALIEEKKFDWLAREESTLLHSAQQTLSYSS